MDEIEENKGYSMTNRFGKKIKFSEYTEEDRLHDLKGIVFTHKDGTKYFVPKNNNPKLDQENEQTTNP